MPVHFTYANLPSLWDDIISASDPGAQLVIRSLDRGLRSAIDSRQLRHLILSPDSGNVFSVRGPRHAVAALRRLDPDSVTDAQRAPCAHTTVIDVRGFFYPTFDVGPLVPLFSGLKVLRMVSDPEQQVTPYVPFPAETLVLFTNPLGLGPVYEHWYFRHPSESSSDEEPGADAEKDYQYEVHGRRLAPRGISRHKLPECCTRLVVNMCGDHSPPSSMWPFCENPLPHVKDVTIVVPRYRTLQGEGEMDADCVESVLAVSMQEMLRPPCPNFTIVGVDEVSDDFEAGLRELLRTDATQVVHADVDYSIDDPLTSEMPVHMRRFAQEASEQMRLAMEENPDEGQRELEEPSEAEEAGAVVDDTEEAAAVAEEAAAVGAEVEQTAEESETEPATGESNRKAGEGGTEPDAKQAERRDQVEDSDAAAPGLDELEGGRSTAVGTVNDRAPATPSTPDGPLIPPSISTKPLMSLQQKVDNLFARIEFLTKDQYVERVGEEAAALELLEYLDPIEYGKKGST